MREEKERRKQERRGAAVFKTNKPTDFPCQDTQGKVSASTFCQEEEKHFLFFFFLCIGNRLTSGGVGVPAASALRRASEQVKFSETLRKPRNNSFPLGTSVAKNIDFSDKKNDCDL